jgi:23S rRNA (guanosine2251-2'-O)-methyltransferase
MWLQNPHSALAVLQKRPQDALELVFSQQNPHAAWAQVGVLAQKKGVKIVSKTKSLEGRSSLNALRIKPKAPVFLEDLLGKKLLFAADTVQDPQNLGAIFRCLAFFGVGGLILTEKRSVGLSSVVYDVACGGVEDIDFCSVVNLRQSLELGKEKGFWVLGASEHAPKSLSQVDPSGSWIVVLGNEQSGLRPLTLETCDVVVKIPSQAEQVRSLNVALAAGIFAYHLSASGSA